MISHFTCCINSANESACSTSHRTGHDSENTCSYQTGTEIGNMFLGNKITAMLKVQKSSAVVYI